MGLVEKMVQKRESEIDNQNLSEEEKNSIKREEREKIQKSVQLRATSYIVFVTIIVCVFWPIVFAIAQYREYRRNK